MLEQFECVRLVRMNGIDLNRFQFDYDQTWAVMFFRHDGTVLARYGARGDRDGMKYNSMEGLTTTMRAVLQVDRNWDSKKLEEYVTKAGPSAKHRVAEEIPSQTISNIVAREKQGKESCIHCHNIYDALRDEAIQLGTYNPGKRFKYPFPQNVGLHVDSVSGTRITEVERQSPAQQAGLKAGHEILRIDGQRIHSLADIQFVLHHTPEQSELPVDVRAPDSNQTLSLVLSLRPGWRRGDISWRASMYGMPPKPGLWVQAANDTEKSKLDIPKNKLALKVRGVFGQEVRRAGLQKGDVITQFGNISSHHTEGEFHAQLRLKYYTPDVQLPLKLIRDGKEMELSVSFANRE